MNITTKGHVETISNDGTMANSWSGNWDSTTQSGDLATIKNTNGVVIEDYRPIENPNELRDYITPRRTMYFGYRAMPRRQEDPVVYDDSKEGGLIKKLESLKTNLKKNVQSRLTWEVTFLKISMEDI